MAVPVPDVALDHLATWAAPFRRLAGDQRTATLLLGILAGILGSGSLVCTRIAAFSPSAGGHAPCRAADSAHADR